MKHILALLALCTLSAQAEFKTVDVATFEALHAKGAPIIDIRTPAEWKHTGVIPDAHKMMFFSPKGEALVTDWFFELGHIVKNKQEPILIYCAHANRSNTLGKGLDAMGFKHVYELKGGIENGWFKAGKKSVK
jgi:rhodanese-related sulfurtransferase